MANQQTLKNGGKAILKLKLEHKKKNYSRPSPKVHFKAYYFELLLSKIYGTVSIPGGGRGQLRDRCLVRNLGRGESI